MLDYPHFRAQSYRIGSGLAESACKRLVSQREKGPGLRWTTRGAQAIATLRAAHLTNRWDEVVKVALVAGLPSKTTRTPRDDAIVMTTSGRTPTMFLRAGKGAPPVYGTRCPRASRKRGRIGRVTFPGPFVLLPGPDVEKGTVSEPRPCIGRLGQIASGGNRHEGK